MRPLFCVRRKDEGTSRREAASPSSPQRAFPKTHPAARGAFLFPNAAFLSPPGTPSSCRVPATLSPAESAAGTRAIPAARPASSATRSGKYLRRTTGRPPFPNRVSAERNRNNHFYNLPDLNVFPLCRLSSFRSVSRETFPARSSMFHVIHSLLFAMSAFM